MVRADRLAEIYSRSSILDLARCSLASLVLLMMIFTFSLSNLKKRIFNLEICQVLFKRNIF